MAEVRAASAKLCGSLTVIAAKDVFLPVSVAPKNDSVALPVWAPAPERSAPLVARLQSATSDTGFLATAGAVPREVAPLNIPCVDQPNSGPVDAKVT